MNIVSDSIDDINFHRYIFIKNNQELGVTILKRLTNTSYFYVIMYVGIEQKGLDGK